MNVEEIARKLILNVLTQFLLLSISRRSEAQVCHHSEEKKKTRTLLSSLPRGLLSYNLNSCTVMLVGNLVKLCNSPYPLIHSPPLFFFFFFLFFFNQQEERGKGGNKKEEEGNVILRPLHFGFLQSRGNRVQEAQEFPLIQIRCSLWT